MNESVESLLLVMLEGEQDEGEGGEGGVCFGGKEGFESEDGMVPR